MTIRAKMKFEALETKDFGSYVQKVARFRAQYDDTIPEDRRFQKATPSASAEFQIDNQAALDQLKPGEMYYFDIVPVSPPAAE